MARSTPEGGSALKRIFLLLAMVAMLAGLLATPAMALDEAVGGYGESCAPDGQACGGGSGGWALVGLDENGDPVYLPGDGGYHRSEVPGDLTWNGGGGGPFYIGEPGGTGQHCDANGDCVGGSSL